MPSDANGVYTLPDGYLAVTGETILASQHNPPLEDLGESMSQRVMATGAKPFTGPAKFADGSVSAPGITFASATSSGWYKTTDGWGFSIGGAMVAEFTSGGIRTGAHYIGELIPFTGLTAPALTVLPYGQTLSRTTYAALWEFAQINIAAGNTIYNNGNGSTTFGIFDMRGRVPAGKDNMGGAAASLLTTATITPSGISLGAVGGAESSTLLPANLPAYTPSGTIANGAITFPTAKNTNAATGSAGAITTGAFSANADFTGLLSPVQAGSTFTGNAQGGTSTAFSNVQPTIITNYILFAGA